MAIWLRLLYATNLILLSLHEMDAVHWREWTLFGIGDDAVGRPVFLLAHVPLLALVLAGFALLDRRPGQALSLALGAFLVAHFFLHRSLAPHAFTGPLSSGIILAMLIVGAAQGVLSLAALRRGAARTP